jgi:hypothetical protein
MNKEHHIERSGTHLGFDWAVIANGMGHRCGYVLIPAGHPWHGKNYNDIYEYPDVHGGLTFSKYATFTSRGYWIGFDCNHLFDIVDPDIVSDEYLPFAVLKAFNFDPDHRGKDCSREDFKRLLIAETLAGNVEGKIRTANYVESECEKLCEAASAAQSDKLGTEV